MDTTRPAAVLPPRWLVAAVALLALIVGGCGSDDDGGNTGASADDRSAPAAAELEGRTFEVTTLDGAELAEGTTINLAFADGSLVVSGGCNTARGPFQVADGRLQVQNMAQTKMACVGPSMEQDTWVNEFLTGAPEIQLGEAKMTLIGDDITINFAEVATTPP